jgi:hypothetical protein
MLKLLYKPFGIVSGILAGLLGRKLFERLWAVADKEDPPKPENRAPWPKLLGALALEGAIFRLTKGAVDNASRRWFASLTGKWPGQERPQAKEEAEKD